MSNSMQFAPVTTIAVGDAIVERDGYMLAVIKVERRGSLVTFTLANDFSPVRAWRSDGGGITLRRSIRTKLATVRGAGREVVLQPGDATVTDANARLVP